MLKSILVQLCLLYYLNKLITAHSAPIFTEKPQSHTRYLKELFPFIQKGDQDDDVSHLLDEIKRERRVCHHGNFKRASHVVHLKPGFKNKRYIRKPFNKNYYGKFYKQKRHNVPKRKSISRNRRKVRNVYGNEMLKRKVRDFKLGNKIKKSIWNSKTFNRLEENDNKLGGSLKNNFRNDKLISKLKNGNLQNDNLQNGNLQNSNLQNSNLQNGNLQNSNLQNGNLQIDKLQKIFESDNLETKLESEKFVNDNKLNNENFENIKKPRSVPKLNSIDEDEFIIRVPDSELVEDIKELTKREVKPSKHKNVKSVITKILIIPVERRVSDTDEDDDTAQKVDIVNVKHSKSGRRKHLGKTQKSTISTIMPFIRTTSSSQPSGSDVTTPEALFSKSSDAFVTEFCTKSILKNSKQKKKFTKSILKNDLSSASDFKVSQFTVDDFSTSVTEKLTN